MIDFVSRILACLPFYLLGALPTGYLIARFHGIDITKEGSGNVGATNIARTIGKKAGISTLVIDIAKGAAAVIIARTITTDPFFYSAAGLFVVCGHCFSIPGRSKGGKGVATSLGVLLALSPISALCAVILFGLVFSVSKIVSLSSVCAVLTAPIIGAFTGLGDAPLYALGLAALVICVRHSENLQRLYKGTEKKFAFKKTEGA